MIDYYVLTSFEEENLDNLYVNIQLNTSKPAEYCGDRAMYVNITNNVLALIDTGASICGISKRTVESMKLKPYREIDIRTATGIYKHHTYLFDVIFPNDKMFENIEAVEIRNPDGFYPSSDFVIGMNILRQGDMAFTSVNGKMCFSFIRRSLYGLIPRGLPRL